MEAFRYGLNVWSIQSKASSITTNLLKRKREDAPKTVRTVVVNLKRKIR
jgi:hypothetical protein